MNNYDFGTSALFVKRRLFVAISYSNIHRFIEGKANYDLNREINIFDKFDLISEMKRNAIVSRTPGQRFTGSGVMGQETA